MYQRGDYIVKVPEGVCKIEEIGQFDISGTDREYYLLLPIAEQSSRIYVPTDNAAGRIRSVIKKAEAMQLIKSIPGINEKEISSEKMREQEYKEAILSGNPGKIVSIIKLLHSRRRKLFFLRNFPLRLISRKKIWSSLSHRRLNRGKMLVVPKSAR